LSSTFQEIKFDKMSVGRKIIRDTLKGMLCCYVYLIIFALILPIICHTWIYSQYFNVDLNTPNQQQRVENQNRVRLISARTYIRSLKNDSLKRFRVARPSKRQLDMVVGIVTMNRNQVVERSIELGYLTQTTAALLSALLYGNKYKEFESIKVFVCNTDSIRHVEAREMSRLVDLIVLTDRVARNPDKFEKEKDDYIFCLKQAGKYQSRYMLLLHDDIILDIDAFETLNHLIRLRITDLNWLYIKLFYPEKWVGYSAETERLGELVGIGIIGGVIATLMKACYLQYFSNQRHFRFSCRVFLVGFLTLSVAAYVIGRQYIRAWRHVSPYTHRLIEASGCCIPAVLYRAQQAAELAQYLPAIRATFDEPGDVFVDKFADMRDYRRYSVEPNIGRHIGYMSTHEVKNASEYLF